MKPAQLTQIVQLCKREMLTRPEMERFVETAFPHGPNGARGEAWDERKFDDIWRLVKDG